jgi:hypothetical protein
VIGGGGGTEEVIEIQGGQVLKSISLQSVFIAESMFIVKLCDL